MALRVARYWNQAPDWFYTLDQVTQVKVLAEYRISHESSEDIKNRQEAIKRAKLQDMISRHQG